MKVLSKFERSVKSTEGSDDGTKFGGSAKWTSQCSPKVDGIRGSDVSWAISLPRITFLYPYTVRR